MNKSLKLLLSCAAIAVISACGGGGDVASSSGQLTASASRAQSFAAATSAVPDTYNAANGQLTISTVQVGSTTFTNVVITIGSLVSIGTGPAVGQFDTYDSKTNQLTIPSVLVGSTTYNNVVINVGSVVSVGDSPFVISGTAAVGASLANASLQIYGADGAALLSTPTSINTDGSYSAAIPSSAKFPSVLEVDTGSDKYYSVMADKTSATINVTQLTNLVSARLSPTGNPLTLVSEVAAGTAKITPNIVATVSADVTTSIAPLLTALSVPKDINPITTSFVANGQGLDRVLDSLDIKIEPKGTTAKAEITLKQTVGESTDLPKLSFSTNTAPPLLSTVAPAIKTADLVPSGLNPKIQFLLDQLTSCYATPLSTRIKTSGSTAADILSQTCKDVFLNSNPASYKANGQVISKTQHYAGLFTADTSAKVTFSDPRYYYSVAKSVSNGPTAGDIVFGYRWKDEYGNFQTEKNVARLDSSGQLKLIGNQYLYSGGVYSYSQRRNFLTQTNSTFNSVGYVLDLSCKLLNIYPSAGNKIVKVIVTSPSGKKTVLIPNLANSTTCNYDYFVIAYSTTTDANGDNSYPSGTSYIRIRTEYETGATTTANHPRVKSTGLAYIGGTTGTDLTTDEIEAIPQFGTWKFDYYTSTSANSSPVATQHYKTTSRALTIEGFKQSYKLPQLTSSVQSTLVNGTTCSSTSPTYCYFSQKSGPFVASWTVDASGALMPATYRARIFGIKDLSVATWIGYEDSITLGSSKRTASILCGQGETTVQPYCSGSTPSAANFGSNASIDAVDLISRASDGSDISHFYTLRKLP